MTPRAFAPTVVACVATLFGSSTFAAGAADPLFASNEILTVRIAAPFKQIMKDRPVDEDNEVDGTFVFVDADGADVEFPVQLLTRGNSRRRPEVCPFAPLRLNFKKSHLQDTLFDKQDKLKLVTHCRKRSTRYQQGVIREYLAYRVFNAITDLSFRVRLLRISYVYADDDNKVEESYAILVEHKNRLGKRIGMDDSKVTTMRLEMLDRAQTNLTSVFQYFIGNADFSALRGASGETCCHNVTLFTADDETFWPIPYDFDLTGFVEPDHFGPPPEDRRSSLRQRTYRGHCVNNDLIPGSLQTFREHKSDIEAIVASQSELSKRTRKNIDSFIAKFYKSLEREEKLVSKLTKDCIG